VREKDTMTIGELAQRAGMRPSTIRYYERLALLPPPVRVSGQRRYDEGALKRLAIVQFAKHVGFSLAAIAQLLKGSSLRPPPERWGRMAHEKMAELDAVIEHAGIVKHLLQETLSDTCPKLAERAAALNIERAALPPRFR